MPPDHSSKYAQVAAHINAGRYEQARPILQRILQATPADAAANNGMSIVLSHLGQLEGALMYAQRAAAAAPTDANILNTLGSAYNALERFADAAKVLEKALAIDPSDAVPRVTFCNALWGLERFVDATEVLAKGLELTPNHPELAARIAPQLVLLGRADEAIARCRAALAAYPSAVDPAIKICSSIVYASKATAAEVVDAHRAYGRSLAAANPTPARTFTNSPEPDRQLRIAFLSSDLRQHSVAYFVESIFDNLEKSKFSITSYANSRTFDAVSERLKSKCAVWRRVDTLNDTDLVARILSDKIDILIDLHGVSVGNRLAVFQMRPAPVQITYCGYPATTGVSSMDYRIVDSITDPPGSEPHCTESLLRIDPCFLCYRPHENAPPPGPPPSVHAGHVTFGSFNTTSKINDRTCALWARVINAVPNSVLMLKSYQFADANTRASFETMFERHGLSRDKLRLLPPEKAADAHLRAYERLDIALDPVPYAGTTTTCEAMWMGVPVVAHRGEMHAGRVGASLLTQVGLQDYIARDEDDYVRIAAALASDLARREDVRTTLRDRMRASPLCDGKSHAERFGVALRTSWRSWCARGSSRA